MTDKFRIVAYIEAATYLVLLAAVLLYRVLDGPDFIGFLGPVHGIAFLVYALLVFMVKEDQKWSLGQMLLVLIAAAIPFGGFFVGRHLEEHPATAS